MDTKHKIAEDLHTFFPDLKFSHGMKSKISRLIYEICKRENMNINKVFEDISLQDKLHSKHLKGKKRIEAIKSILEKRRYPEYSSHKEKIESLLASLKLPDTIHVRPSPYFESRWLEIEFKISSPNDLLETSGKLLQVAKNPILTQIFKIL